jgi:hypothetical protein
MCSVSKLFTEALLTASLMDAKLAPMEELLFTLQMVAWALSTTADNIKIKYNFFMTLFLQT